ncbi:MAG: isopentenyl phosphate kinase family protein [Anaerolineales bacterium]|nr:isopentenyl phosphate kinase family protein [Anaerolineales bacterium]
MSELVFLKLGGSLITDKHTEAMLRPEVVRRIVQEIAAARQANPGLRLVLGHGSGSFGHVPAKKHGTRQGVRTHEQWLGFVEVWRYASALNQAIMGALQAVADQPAISFAPVSSVLAAGGRVHSWNLQPIRAALAAGILPVVYGDVIFDSELGGTILSTEDLFVHLAAELQPARILLAGNDAGVYDRYPDGNVVPHITPASYAGMAALPGASAATDVTGGMASKVEAMLSIVQALPSCTVSIFSGQEAGNISKALLGETMGTLIASDQ